MEEDEGIKSQLKRKHSASPKTGNVIRMRSIVSIPRSATPKTGRKSQVKGKRPVVNIPGSASPKTVTDDETEEEEEEMEDGSDDGGWEYALGVLKSRLGSTSASIGTEADTEAPGSPYFVDRSEYPPNADIYSEQFWDLERNCSVARVPRWARREYEEMNPINPTTQNASDLEGTITPKKKQPRMVARLK